MTAFYTIAHGIIYSMASWFLILSISGSWCRVHKEENAIRDVWISILILTLVYTAVALGAE